MRELLSAAALALATAHPHSACAARPAAIAPAETSLFVSPAGKPFRAEQGDAYPVGRWHAEADADANGSLTVDEFVRDALAYFAFVDQDRDEELGVDEVRRYERDLVPEIQPRNVAVAGGGGGPVSMPFRGAPGGGANRLVRPGGGVGRSKSSGYEPHTGLASVTLLGETHPLMAADADMNRGVSKTEFELAARRRFRSLDRDADGKLRLAELPATLAQTRAERRGKAR